MASPSWLRWLDPERPHGGAALKARLYLQAVLPTLAELWPLEAEMRAAAGEAPFSIAFQTLGAARQALAFDGSRAWAWQTTEAAQLELVFLTARQAIATFEQRGALPPLPRRGFNRLGHAKRFEAAAAVMAKRLRPAPEALTDESTAARFAHLQLGIALRGAVLLIRFEAAANAHFTSAPHGVAVFAISGIEQPRWIDYTPGTLGTGVGDPPREPDTTITFSTGQIAAASVRDEIDAMAAVNAGRIRLHGLVPLADHLNHLMEHVSDYLPR